MHKLSVKKEKGFVYICNNWTIGETDVEAETYPFDLREVA